MQYLRLSIDNIMNNSRILKTSIAAFILLFSVSTLAMADEGMWMVNAINRALEMQMQGKGLKMNAREIYNADSVSLTDAIVSIDFMGTGSIISQQGLLITNHHVAYEDVHNLSTPEHNYLEDGFWARNASEEVYIPERHAIFLHKVLDVTDEVNALIDEYRSAGKPYGSRKLSYDMEKRYKSDEYEASLNSMWAGSKYYMALYKVYSDVRLVAAPPVSIAAFGGDVDNWEWPQHKCDFAMYRVYMGKDGKPAAHSSENVPFRPEKWLPISTEGYAPGDYTMVLGFPGRTDRYSSSAKVSYQQFLSYPITNALRAQQMKIISGWMDKDPQIRLKYANTFFGLSNVAENNEGLVECCGRFGVIDLKKEVEKRELLDKEENAGIINALDETYKTIASAEKNLIYFRESLIRGSSLCLVAMRIHNTKKGAPIIDELYSSMDMRVEKDRFNFAMQTFYKNVDSSMWAPFQKEVYNKFSTADSVRYADMLEYLWTDERMTKEDNIYKFLTDANVGMYNKVVDRKQSECIKKCACKKNCVDFKNINSVQELGRLYTRALYKSRLERGVVQYPDANSTLRLTYGTVGSFPRDGKQTPWQTFSNEILSKEDVTKHDFTLNDKWRSLLQSLDGRKIPVNFITDNDITGGNSGSPVLNGKGEIIGLAFDGNKESLAGDVYWVPGFTKCICVDIRFVLWTLKEYAGMDYLFNEMELK